MNTRKKIKTTLAAMLCILLASLITPYSVNAQSPIKGDAADDTKQKVQELNKQMEDAFRSGDMVKVADFYADDATLIAPGGNKIQGRKAIFEYLTAMKDAKDFHLDVTDVNGSGKVLYQVGTLTFTAEKNGTKESHSADQVKVWKRGTDWDYKISVESFN
jgi:uncharacterized protein (TIGR02246 family)